MITVTTSGAYDYAKDTKIIHIYLSNECHHSLHNGRNAPIFIPEGQDMPEQQKKTANLNLKITEDERWDFKAFCVQHRMSQVDGFRLALKLMKDHFAENEK